MAATKDTIDVKFKALADVEAMLDM